MTGKSFRTHYDNLKVARDAPPEVIRAAYKSLAQKYHPDRNPGDPNSARILAVLNAAYSTLSDPEKRRQHDAWIAAKEVEEQAENSVSAEIIPPAKAPDPSHQPFRPGHSQPPVITLSRKNIILLTIAAALAAFLFPPYTITNYKGVVLESGWYFVLGDKPIHMIVNNVIGGIVTAKDLSVIHATINIPLLVVELVVIGIAGAALAYTAKNQQTIATPSTATVASRQHGNTEHSQKIPLSETELKMKNAKGWGLSAFAVVALVTIVGLVTSPGSNEEIMLEAVKGTIGATVWAMLAFAYGWFTGGKK